ncbi:hypothetical protein L6164_016797 [Bauhinia variegata]|uniref:Uncharacterized protein n=1 Tax=Bauhinia variegata TaxID=167791 RepID=A0ACB9N5K4_BAUVA|nr:hypothetical protein L6164_016797 [Bauhinia variegata]
MMDPFKDIRDDTFLVGTLRPQNKRCNRQPDMHINPYEGMEYMSEELHIPENSDDDEAVICFELGTVFANLAQFKQALKDYCVYEGKELIFVKNDKEMYRIFCQPPCPFTILYS